MLEDGTRFTILKNMSPQRQTKKVFKSIRDVPSAFNNVSTATDYNFKAIFVFT